VTSRSARPRHLLLVVLAALLVVLGGCVDSGSGSGSESPDGEARGQDEIEAGREAAKPEGRGEGEDPAAAALDDASAPESPPVEVCGNDEILGNGPAAPPEGSVEVPAGDNSSVDFSRPGTTYWFAPGVHTLGSGTYASIEPGSGARFVGAPGAVLDGGKVNRYAFTGHGSDVVVEYLTIQNFGAVGENNNEGVVNHNSAKGWTVRYNTIRHNAGAGLMIGSGSVVRFNCLTRNGQYGFNAYSPTGPVDVTLDHNELSHNNTYDWESRIEGCGCTGGGKFWAVRNAVVTNNYVHDNKGVGLWADNNNRGFLIALNYIADNDEVGLMYETSYNALIRSNTIVGNGHVGGPRNPGFPTGGIYVSEAGADRRVETRYGEALEISGNLLRDNWSGIVLWENADRYCGSPANTSTGECTLVNPRAVTERTCNADNIREEPYFTDCRWKTQNVEIHDNVFEHSPSRIGQECTFDNACGVMAIMSNYGTYPDWSPYTARTVQEAVTYEQGNVFRDNTYRGSWRFMPFEQNRLVSFDEWREAPYEQDSGSIFETGAE
jgi:hypothetical protein